MWTRFVSEILNITAILLIGASLLLETALGPNARRPAFDPTAMQITLASMQPIVEANAVFPKTLSVCPQMTVSNQPYPIKNRDILRYRETIALNGVEIAMAPVEAACLSSGFGPRYGRMHKGIDLFHRDPVPIYAAGPGIIREKQYHSGFGNMIVIDHGSELYTRYAHLETFASGLEIGDQVIRGRRIGTMGHTADYAIARHLHYELLTGDWNDATGSFTLDAMDMFALAAAN
ncbi:MAG: M23 family metallopeptidase [Pseudomonadota bacterium]